MSVISTKPNGETSSIDHGYHTDSSKYSANSCRSFPIFSSNLSGILSVASLGAIPFGCISKYAWSEQTDIRFVRECQNQKLCANLLICADISIQIISVKQFQSSILLKITWFYYGLYFKTCYYFIESSSDKIDRHLYPHDSFKCVIKIIKSVKNFYNKCYLSIHVIYL